jgi:hypothetical protein
MEVEWRDGGWSRRERGWNGGIGRGVVEILCVLRGSCTSLRGIKERMRMQDCEPLFQKKTTVGHDTHAG